MSDLTQIVKSYLPGNWDDVPYDNKENVFKTLPTNTQEYNDVKRELKSTFVPTRIVRVENPYLWACYQLKKEEYSMRVPGRVGTEQILWHATGANCAASIAEVNFDWRRTNRAKFGQGVCFSPSHAYAHQWSTHTGALIRAKVLVNQKSVGTDSTRIPSRGSDTTVGTFQGDTVYVKYADNEFYPEYIVFYDGPPQVRRGRNPSRSHDDGAFWCDYGHDFPDEFDGCYLDYSHDFPDEFDGCYLDYSHDFPDEFDGCYLDYFS